MGREETIKVFMNNPYWKSYYDKAPSEECKEFIKWSFAISSEDDDEEAEKMYKEAEKNLSKDDIQYLYDNEENQMAKSYWKKKLQ